MSDDVTSVAETAETSEIGSTTGGPTPDGPVKKRSRLGRWWWVAGVVIVALVVVVFAPLASRDPDGLERVAADQGFIDRASNFFSGILAGYGIPGISDPTVSTIVSGLIGVAIVLVIMFALGRVLARRRM